MHFNWMIVALALTLMFLPEHLPAQNVTAIFDGHAEITVPDGFRREELPDGKVRDRFFSMRYVETFPPNSPYIPLLSGSNVTLQIRAYFDFIEFPLTLGRKSANSKYSPEFFESSLNSIIENSAKGIWCPGTSARGKDGTFGIMFDPDTGFSHCFGALGAASYLVCKKFPEVVLCANGIDMAEFGKWERSGVAGFQDNWTDVQLLESLRGAGNVAVLESVLKSFRYR